MSKGYSPLSFREVVVLVVGIFVKDLPLRCWEVAGCATLKPAVTDYPFNSIGWVCERSVSRVNFAFLVVH